MKEIYPNWQKSPQRILIKEKETHLWYLRLERSDKERLYLQNLLSIDELNRAKRFVFEKDQASFIVARGLLRKILGQYANSPPDVLKFSYNIYGKPFLTQNGTQSVFDFNISHSHNVALLGITRKSQIGVDVEKLNPDIAIPQIAESYFSKKEASLFRSLPKNKKVEGFFKCWTCKEAYIKAKGKGLSIPLDGFHVDFNSPGQPRLLKSNLYPKDVNKLDFYSFNIAESFAAAVVVDKYISNFKYYQL